MIAVVLSLLLGAVLIGSAGLKLADGPRTRLALGTYGLRGDAAPPAAFRAAEARSTAPRRRHARTGSMRPPTVAHRRALPLEPVGPERQAGARTVGELQRRGPEQHGAEEQRGDDRQHAAAEASSRT